MNRRGFIATLTALAGLAVAKIKAPAGPFTFKNNGKTLFIVKDGHIYAPAGEQLRVGDPVCIKDGKVYRVK